MGKKQTRNKSRFTSSSVSMMALSSAMLRFGQDRLSRTGGCSQRVPVTPPVDAGRAEPNIQPPSAAFCGSVLPHRVPGMRADVGTLPLGGSRVVLDAEQHLAQRTHCSTRVNPSPPNLKHHRFYPPVSQQGRFPNDITVHFQAMNSSSIVSDRNRHNVTRVKIQTREEETHNTLIYDGRLQSMNAGKQVQLFETLEEELEKGTPTEILSLLLDVLSLDSSDKGDGTLSNRLSLAAPLPRPAQTDLEFKPLRAVPPKDLARPLRARFYVRPLLVGEMIIPSGQQPQSKTNSPPPRGALYAEPHVCPLVSLSRFLISQERDLVAVVAGVQRLSSEEWEKRAQIAKLADSETLRHAEDLLLVGSDRSAQTVGREGDCERRN